VEKVSSHAFIFRTAMKASV